MAEGDTLVSIESVIGGIRGDLLIGTDKANLLAGDDGRDTLIGHGGDDTLIGGQGNDVLKGGLGVDVLIGDPGKDTFVFNSLDSSGVGAGNRDIIQDFEDHDKILLQKIDANPSVSGDQAFAWLDTGSFTGAGAELRYERDGETTIVSADLDGDLAADFQIELAGRLRLSEDQFGF